jgi:hypothetical protein
VSIHAFVWGSGSGKYPAVQRFIPVPPI